RSIARPGSRRSRWCSVFPPCYPSRSDPMNSLRAFFEKRHGTAEWDAVLRATGVVALLALYPSYHWPWIAGLVGFFSLTLFFSSPLNVVLPATFEPMLMVAGR